MDVCVTNLLSTKPSFGCVPTPSIVTDMFAETIPRKKTIYGLLLVKRTTDKPELILDSPLTGVFILIVL